MKRNNMTIWHTHKQTRKQKKQLLFRGAVKKSVYLGEIGRKIKLVSFFAKKKARAVQGHAVTNNFKKYKLYFKKKVWYMDKAAPIPGGNMKLSMGFVKKHKKMVANTLMAYKFLNRFLAIFNKKRSKKQYNRTNRDIRNSVDFSALMQMDSLFHSSMRKTALILKPQDKNIACSYFLNGKYVIKKNFVLYRSIKAIQKDGDFCIMALAGSVLI